MINHLWKMFLLEQIIKYDFISIFKYRNFNLLKISVAKRNYYFVSFACFRQRTAADIIFIM